MSDVLNKARQFFDVRNLPYLLGLSDRATYTPKPLDLTKITTDAQARDAIDSIIGVNDEARKQAQAIAYYKDQGGLSKSVSLLQSAFGTSDQPFTFSDATANLIQGLPFTPEGDARLATKNFVYNPVQIADDNLNKQLADPAVFTEYMRLTAPQQILPYLVERDQGKLGKDENVLRNIAGNPIGALWHVASSLFTGKTTGRIEEMLGEIYYQNAIPDPYLRLAMARKAWDFKINFWDPQHTNERAAFDETHRIVAEGLTGPAAAQAMETYFSQHPGGGAAFLGNLIGQVAFDPLNFIPADWIAKPLVIPLKNVTAGESLTRFLRLATPTGRRIVKAGGAATAEGFTEQAFRNAFNLEGYRALTRMPELSYAAARHTEPVKGLTRLLFEQPANLFADSVRTKFEFSIAPVARQLAADPSLIAHISETFRTGKPTAWVAQNLPHLLEDPTMADLSARMTAQKSEIFDQAMEHLTETFDKWKEAGIWKLDATPDEVRALTAAGKAVITQQTIERQIPEYLSAIAHGFASKSQQQLWEATGMGRFLSQVWFPFAGMLKSVTAQVTLTGGSGFTWLQIPSNTIRLMVDSVSHPGEAMSALARSFWLEGSTVLKEGGQYPDVWMPTLKAFGLTPLDVERNISRVTGAHDLLGRALVEADETILNDSLKTFQQAMIHPAKEIGARSRITDKIFFPLHIANRMDKVTRRAAFMSNLRHQVHLGFAPGGEFRAGLGPIRDVLTAAGRSAPEIALFENGFADEMKSFLLGKKPMPEGFSAIDEGVFTHALEARLGKIESGTASGLLSAHDYGRRFAREILGHTDPRAEVFATQDISQIMDYIHTDILPMLDEAQKTGDLAAFTPVMKKIDRMMETFALQYDVPADIARQAARLPTTIRGKTTYAGALRVTDDAMRWDMIDNVSLLDRLLGIVKGEAWVSKRQSVWGLQRQWQTVAENAVTQNLSRLRDIRSVYDELARAGEEQVTHAMLVPEKILAKLPDDLKIGTRAATAGEQLREALRLSVKEGVKPKKAIEQAVSKAPVSGAGLTVGQLWDNYFTRRSTSFDEMFSFVRDAISKSSKAHAGLIDKLQEMVKDNFAQHRSAIADALSAGGDDAWRAAGERVRQLYEQGASKKAAALGMTVNDFPKAQQMMDHNAVLARTVHEFKDYFMQSLRGDIPKLMNGELAVAPEAVNTVRGAISKVQENWPDLRDTMLGNARLATDFTMLNYLDQRGLDRIIQMVVPFEFWPTRDALHWAIRGSRAPGAFAALTIAMFQAQDVAKQYGYPQRLQNRIPIPLPGLDEFLNKLPGIGGLMEAGNFSPVYFIDPLRFVFPYTFLRDQYDDPARRNTPLGRFADFMQNSTPLNLGPFQMFAFRQAGLLDKDAWHSTYLSGGPLGIPMTPLARATARFVFTGDTEAIPKDQQQLYATKGHFGPGWLRDLLGLDNQQFDEWRAERALASLVATGELIPGAPKDEQLQKAWVAMDSHKGPEWNRAVKAAESETNLRRFTSWVGFPFGDIIGVNEGEMIWFGLKALYGEASRQGKLDEFFQKYPEFELRTAAVRGLSDPAEREKAVDTELYYQGIDRYVEAPFEKAMTEINNEELRLSNVTQTSEVRDHLAVIHAEARAIRDEQQKRRDTLDTAFPFREQELSLNRDPKERALAQIRTDWFALQRGDGETADAFDFRREQFLEQFPTVTDVLGHEDQWQQLRVQFMLTRITAAQERDAAYGQDNFIKAHDISAARDAALTDIHAEATKLISRQDVERYLASYAWPKTQAQQEFEQADALKDLWFTLTGSGSPFTSREKGAVSAYFRSLPVMQKYFPVEVLSLADLSVDQRFALMRRKDFWSTYYSFQDAKTQLDYAHMMKPIVDQANALLGMPPLEILDIPPYPVESSGDPLFDHIQMMSALNRKDAVAGDQSLTPDQQTELERLLATVGATGQDTSLTSTDVSRLLAPYTMEDPTP